MESNSPEKTRSSFVKTEYQSGYRSDITGLRGIAVLLVLLCHFQIPGFEGGFIGPDIFFVISGFLITGLLVKEYAASVAARSRGKVDGDAAIKKSRKSRRGKISFTGFYLRRARRILPAAIVVLIAINLYAIINLNILQQSQIQADSLWTALFMANVNFLRQSMDYFAQGTNLSPLQHYWTLSVEEQFYLIWPVLFVAATRLNGLKIFGIKVRWRSRVLATVALLGILSLGWLFFEFSHNPLSAYFSTFSRAWELALGGILGFYVAANSDRNFKPASLKTRLPALIILLASIAIVTPDNFGYTLVIPVAATGVLLYTGVTPGSDLVSTILSNKVLLWIGTISYSLYLWHWPVFVFGQQLGLMNSLAQRSLGMALCFVLAVLSYQYVERVFMQIPLPKPKKTLSKKNAKSFSIPAITASSVIAILWLFTYSGASMGLSGTQGKPWFPNSSQQVDPTATPTTQSSSAATLSELPAWTEKIKAGLSLDAVPNNMVSQLRATQILDYPWKTQMTCLPDSQLPPKSDGMKSTYCQTKSVPGGKKLVVVGDSFAGSLMPAVINSVDLQKWQVITIFRLECMWSDVTPIGYKSNKALSGCPTARDWTFKKVAEINPDLLILTEESIHKLEAPKGKRLDVWASGVDRSLGKAKASSKKVLVVGMHPGIPPGGLSKCLDKNLGLTSTCFGDARTGSEYRTIQRNLTDKYSMGYLDLTPWLCTYGKCPPIIDSKIVYADSFHFTPLLAKSLAPAFKESYVSQQLLK